MRSQNLPAVRWQANDAMTLVTSDSNKRTAQSGRGSDVAASASIAQARPLGRSGTLAPQVQAESSAIRWGAVEPDARREMTVRIAVGDQEDLRFAV
jgi:hypothetical protein